MKLLLLAPFPYDASAGHGGAVVCSAQLTELARHHEVQVLCFAQGGEAEARSLAAMGRVAVVQTVPMRVSKWVALRAKLSSLWGRWPEIALYHRSKLFEAALHDRLSSWQPDVVITQFPQMAQYLGHVQGRPAVHDVQDAFSVSWYRRAKGQRGLRGWYARRQWLAWVSYEALWYPMARECWTLSTPDAHGLRVFQPELAVLDMGLPMVRVDAKPAPDTLAGTAEAVPAQLGFLASFTHSPNIEALRFIVQVLAPALAKSHPALRWRIAGRSPPPELVAAAPPSMQFLGFVDSVADFYADCTLVVAPLLSGGGVKVKVAEAMAYGKAVVTTPVGAEGIPGLNGESICVCTPEAMPGVISRLLADPALRSRIGVAAAVSAQQQFGCEAWLARADQRLLALVEPAA